MNHLSRLSFFSFPWRGSVGTLLLAFDHGDIALDLWRRVGGMILIAMGVLYVFLVRDAREQPVFHREMDA